MPRLCRGSCVDLVILKYARTWWADRPRYHLRHSSGVSSGSGFRTFLRLPSKTACITFLHAFRIQIWSNDDLTLYLECVIVFNRIAIFANFFILRFSLVFLLLYLCRNIFYRHVRVLIIPIYTNRSGELFRGIDVNILRRCKSSCQYGCLYTCVSMIL